MAHFQLRINADDVEHPFIDGAPSQTVAQFRNILNRVIGGAISDSATLYAKHTLVAASGTVTLEESSGTVGATINGVSVTTAFDTDDDTTASALSAAINASVNALVANHVTASATDNVVTITAVNPGITGNTITLAASGTGATASGARLTGGSESRVTYTF